MFKKNSKVDSNGLNEIIYLGKNKGCMVKGGIVDFDKVIDIVLNDIKSGKIKGITFDRYEDVK